MTDSVVFDLGKVLLDWDPRYYYSQYFEGDEAGLEHFVQVVVASSWIVGMDAGLPHTEAIARRQQEHPQHAHLIASWMQGWPLMLKGEIAGTAQIIRELKDRGLRLYALTNFSSETFPIAREVCPTLALFEDIVVSGDIGLVKPDPRIYAHTTERCRLVPQSTLFIDDMEVNVQAARAAGWQALQFTSPESLRAALIEHELLPAEAAR
jgi:2-haloacid dehalogenase